MVTAKVPLSMVVLNDFMKRRNLPADLRLRLVSDLTSGFRTVSRPACFSVPTVDIGPALVALQILPTDGTLSVSLWDAPSAEAVTGWLDENLNQDGSHEVFEVRAQLGFFEGHRAATGHGCMQNADSWHSWPLPCHAPA